MSTRLAFRTRGGPTQGWGNVFRLASFAEHCRQAGSMETRFFVEGPPAVETFLVDRGFDVVTLPEDLDLVQEERVLARHDSAEVLFVEMLDITPERQRLLRRHADRLVVFDDLCDRIYDAHLVVCGQELPSHANQELGNPETRFLVGYDYFLCRPEFLPYVDRERVHRPRLEHVLVTLGGGSYEVGSLKAALALAELDVAATFVLGYADDQGLADRIRAILPDAQVVGGVSDLDRRLWECDVVISSAGYTKLEAAITQTPQVMMSAQWHQLPLAQAFSARTGTVDLGYMSYVQPAAITAALRALAPAEARRDAALRARDVVDGRGFERVHRACFEE